MTATTRPITVQPSGTATPGVLGVDDGHCILVS